MKAVMVMYDSLNRLFLPPYGCEWVKAPNFARLAEHTVAFDNSYVGSLPCMPARRELHTGRYNFLHRFWSPIDPFDDSMPELLKKAGIHTHIVTDHCHYWEDGGATYHNRYSTWEGVRGQEGDYCIADLDPAIQGTTAVPASNPAVQKFKAVKQRQDAVNRKYEPTAADAPQTAVFDKGCRFLDINHGYDNWFLTVEAFDPHEPFFSFEEYQKLYDIPDIGKQLDWPPYDKVRESEEEIAHLRAKYAALVTECDESLGRILDKFDEYDLWKDTMLIVNTDHGFMLGEHGWWAKNIQPCYDEIVHTPLFIWDPRCGCRGEHRQALVQTIDLAPTLMEYFGQPQTPDMQGAVLKDTIAKDTAVRDTCIFGYFGNQFNVTDGRYVFMAAGDPTVEQFEYTLMPTVMNNRMGDVLEKATLAPPFRFTKNMPTLKIPARQIFGQAVTESMLFDLQEDPKQEHPFRDAAIEERLMNAAAELMRRNDAPEEQFTRLGLRK